MVPEGWEVVPFGELADFKNGLNFNKDDDGRAIKVVGIPDFWQRTTLTDFSGLKTITCRGEVGESHMLRSGDLLFVRSNGNPELVGRCLFFPVVDEPISFSGFTIRGRVDTRRMLPEFAAGLLTSDIAKDQIRKGGGGTNISNLSQDILGGIPVFVPPLPEQQKIAEILGTWDKAIQTTEALLANARNQKRALMQSLFTGSQRFPGFEDHPWREVRLGDVVRLSKDRLDPRRPHNTRRCIELEHIEGETGRLLGETASDQQASIKAVFEPGDILFGKLRPYLRKFLAPDFSGVCSTEIWVLKPVGSKLTSEFLHLIVQGDGFMEEASRSSGSKMPRAEWGVVADYRMMLPVIEEQTQIAAVLQDADKDIDHLTGQLDHLRTEKKSLMQQLLTGRRRMVPHE